jgi:hypothetical protein
MTRTLGESVELNARFMHQTQVSSSKKERLNIVMFKGNSTQLRAFLIG